MTHLLNEVEPEIEDAVDAPGRDILARVLHRTTKENDDEAAGFDQHQDFEAHENYD
jgi:hypothetical protein